MVYPPLTLNSCPVTWRAMRSEARNSTAWAMSSAVVSRSSGVSFEAPDGSTFAVSDPGGMGDTGRSLGFLVGDLEAAVSELRAHGFEVNGVGENARERYAHFRAPDGHLYELVQRH